MKIESILDPKQTTFSPAIFLASEGDETPILRDDIRQQILSLAAQWSKYGRILEIYIIGGILTKQYTDTSDVDVTVLLRPFNEASLENAKHEAFNSVDTYMAGTSAHPINVFVRETYSFENADVVYDILRSDWVKHTELADLSSKLLGLYHTQFQDVLKSIDTAKDELSSDLISYDKIQNLNKNDVSKLSKQLETKLADIDDDVKQLVNTYNVVHALRKSIFDKSMTLDQIKTYRSKNLLPENILYKLLEKYHYTQFLSQLKKVLKDADGAIDTPDEIEELKKLFTNVDFEEFTVEMTSSGAAGGFAVPIGTKISRRKRKKKRRDQTVVASLYNV